ncbi:MAG TPA: hypothetical protein PK308_06195 [Phycisphaerales bacterium]|jgi:hypothetical protein|nr:hypothetical protein [Phycisphaerales bacterium]
MAAEHIRIMCPSLTCRKILAVPVTSRGKNVRCKNCGATIRVPDNRGGGKPADAPAPGAAAQPNAPKAA